MSLWTRMANVFRSDRVNHELDEEFGSHMEEAVAEGRDPEEVRRAFGSMLRQREASREVRVITWLDGLRADLIFGWRQLKRNRVSSAIAVFSLAIAMGACVGAFRLIDALLWRPLPVAHADSLFALSRSGVSSEGKFYSYDGWAYPSFSQMRAAVKDQAELIAVSYAERTDLTYGSDDEMEKASVQYVSGWMFDSFGLHPALGRLFTERDDQKPGAAPYVVLSYDYWTHRFGQDRGVIGRTLHIGNGVYQIVGVAERPFTGTETGIVTDIFLPIMMNRWVTRNDASWHRTLVVVKPEVALEPLRQKLNAVSQAFEQERAKGLTGQGKQFFQDRKEAFLMEPAQSGASNLQGDYRRALGALGLLVAMVLLIVCVNVANLMTAQAAARAREMALRVSIGAGRLRLMQMVLVESAMLAAIAASIGAVIAWWSAPFVVSVISTQDNPTQLMLPADWRVLGFALALTFGVMFLFGLAPALRASSIKPVSALKGGDDPHRRRRMMHGMIAAQVAFCFLVVFVSGLFVTTFQRLSNRPLGFSSERLLLLETVSREVQLPVVWDQIADRLRATPGVERVSIQGWPLLAGGAWNGFVLINRHPTGPTLAFFMTVSPGWVDTMKIPFVDGRDFRESDASPGQAIVNQTFVKTYFNGQNPIGKSFEKGEDRYTIVGVVRDAPYRSLREPILPVAYVPTHEADAKGILQPEGRETMVVRTSSTNPLAMASLLRKTISQARAGFRVSNINIQDGLVRAQTIRERLLAMLAIFFAGVALLLAGIGLYGVLNYSVLQRRREIGIRMAIGAQRSGIVQLVTINILAMIIVGTLAGLGLGLASAQYIEALFYQVKATDVSMLAVPLMAILGTALIATLPAISRALRVDPAEILRAE